MSRNVAQFGLLLAFSSLMLMPFLFAAPDSSGSISILLYGPDKLAAGPILAFMAAFTITVILELFVAYAILSYWGADDRLLIWIIISNTISWPFLILFAPTLDTALGHEAGFIAGEAAVIIAEGLVLFVASPKSLGIRHALVLSLVTNMASAAVSIILTQLFFPILYY